MEIYSTFFIPIVLLFHYVYVYVCICMYVYTLVGAARDLFYIEDKELDFDEILNSPLPKVPLDCKLNLHWLAIEGVIPTTPENPPPGKGNLQFNISYIICSYFKGMIDKSF